jgi:hypothetical protein
MDSKEHYDLLFYNYLRCKGWLYSFLEREESDDYFDLLEAYVAEKGGFL